MFSASGVAVCFCVQGDDGLTRWENQWPMSTEGPEVLRYLFREKVAIQIDNSAARRAGEPPWEFGEWIRRQSWRH
jgi:hypothetical protein